MVQCQNNSGTPPRGYNSVSLRFIGDNVRKKEKKEEEERKIVRARIFSSSEARKKEEAKRRGHDFSTVAPFRVNELIIVARINRENTCTH